MATDDSTKANAGSVGQHSHESCNGICPQLLRMFLCDTNPARFATSTTAQKEQGIPNGKSETLTQIGEGTCAEIFAQGGTGVILKRARPGWEDDLWVDYGVHRSIAYSMEVHSILGFQVPRCLHYIMPSNDAFWAPGLHNFAEEHRTSERRSVIVAERIPALHEAIQRLLIQQFCPEQLQAAALVNAKNRDCLVRLYLGKRQQASVSSSAAFSLRNFELTVDRMEAIDIGIEKQGWAHSIGQGLAVIHWGARQDGRGVEFVLGGAPAEMIPRRCELNPRMPADTLEMEAHTRRRLVHIWMLDFDRCRPITMDEAGCRQAAAAHWDNEPYYPRPDRDYKLWSAFQGGYLSTAGRIAGAASPLPQMYLDAVIAECQRRFPWSPSAAAPTGLARERARLPLGRAQGKRRMTAISGRVVEVDDLLN